MAKLVTLLCEFRVHCGFRGTPRPNLSTNNVAQIEIPALSTFSCLFPAREHRSGHIGQAAKAELHRHGHEPGNPGDLGGLRPG